VKKNLRNQSDKVHQRQDFAFPITRDHVAMTATPAIPGTLIATMPKRSCRGTPAACANGPALQWVLAANQLAGQQRNQVFGKEHA